MEQFRIRLKVGSHEFEAEGDQESVERQLAAWRELISSPSTLASPPPLDTSGAGAPAPNGPSERAQFDKIFRFEGGLVSLSVPPGGEHRESDAALLLLLGQRIYNGDELVTGSPILAGMARSGLSVPRIDRVFSEMEQYVIRVGSHRAVRYRLTNPGLERAREVAFALAKTVA